MKSSKVLKDLDRSFCKQAMKNGVEAWTNHFDDDGKMVVKSGVVEGKVRIASRLQPLYSLPDLHFEWEPVEAFMSDDETLGVTMGHYVRSYTLKEEAVREEGYYTTIWTKDQNQWKIFMDIGN